MLVSDESKWPSASLWLGFVLKSFPRFQSIPGILWCIGFWMLWSDDSIFTFPIFNSICVRVNNTLTIIRVIKRAIRWNRGHRNAYSVMSRRAHKPFIIKNRIHKNRSTYLLNQCLVSLLMMWIFSAILGTFRCHLIGSTERVHSVTSSGHWSFFSQSVFASIRFTLVVSQCGELNMIWIRVSTNDARSLGTRCNKVARAGTNHKQTGQVDLALRRVSLLLIRSAKSIPIKWNWCCLMDPQR